MRAASRASLAAGVSAPVVEEVPVDAVGQQRLEVGVVLRHQPAEQPARAVAAVRFKPMRAGAQEPVRVGDPELETAAGFDRARSSGIRIRSCRSSTAA